MLTIAPLARPARRFPRQNMPRHRAEFPAVFARPAVTAAPVATRPAPSHEAAHDFLVANPRPDLTRDAHLQRMLEHA